MSACLQGRHQRNDARRPVRRGPPPRATNTRTSSGAAISSSKFRITASTTTRKSCRRSAASRMETGIPLVATNDAHYLQHDDARAQEVLLCIQTGKTMTDANRMQLLDRAVLPENARRDDDSFRRSRRRARPHLGHRPALQGQAREGQGALPASSTSRPSTPSTRTSNTWPARASKSGADRLEAPPARRAICGTTWPNTSNGSTAKSS